MQIQNVPVGDQVTVVAPPGGKEMVVMVLKHGQYNTECSVKVDNSWVFPLFVPKGTEVQT